MRKSETMKMDGLTVTLGQHSSALSLEMWQINLYQTTVLPCRVVWPTETDTGPKWSVAIDPIQTARQTPPSRIQQLRNQVSERLTEICLLPENWDSYGAHRIDPLAILEAKTLLEMACETEEQDFKMPAIAPHCQGGVELEWFVETGRELIVEIPPAGEPITFLWVETSESGKVEECEGLLDGYAHLQRLVRKLEA